MNNIRPIADLPGYVKDMKNGAVLLKRERPNKIAKENIRSRFKQLEEDNDKIYNLLCRIVELLENMNAKLIR